MAGIAGYGLPMGGREQFVEAQQVVDAGGESGLQFAGRFGALVIYGDIKVVR